MSFLFAYVVDRDNGIVFKRGNGFGFALKTVAGGGIVQCFFRKQFDGDIALEAGIVSVIDGCHTALAQFRFDFVAANFLGGHGVEF